MIIDYTPSRGSHADQEMTMPTPTPRILSLADLRDIGAVTFVERRRDAQRYLTPEARLEQWARAHGYDLTDFFGGSVPQFRGISIISLAVDESDIYTVQP